MILQIIIQINKIENKVNENDKNIYNKKNANNLKNSPKIQNHNSKVRVLTKKIIKKSITKNKNNQIKHKDLKKTEINKINSIVASDQSVDKIDEQMQSTISTYFTMAGLESIVNAMIHDVLKEVNTDHALEDISHSQIAAIEAKMNKKDEKDTVDDHDHDLIKETLRTYIQYLMAMIMKHSGAESIGLSGMEIKLKQGTGIQKSDECHQGDECAGIDTQIGIQMLFTSFHKNEKAVENVTAQTGNIAIDFLGMNGLFDMILGTKPDPKGKPPAGKTIKQYFEMDDRPEIITHWALHSQHDKSKEATFHTKLQFSIDNTDDANQGKARLSLREMELDGELVSTDNGLNLFQSLNVWKTKTFSKFATDIVGLIVSFAWNWKVNLMINDLKILGGMTYNGLPMDPIKVTFHNLAFIDNLFQLKIGLKHTPQHQTKTEQERGLIGPTDPRHIVLLLNGRSIIDVYNNIACSDTITDLLNNAIKENSVLNQKQIVPELRLSFMSEETNHKLLFQEKEGLTQLWGKVGADYKDCQTPGNCELANVEFDINFWIANGNIEVKLVTLDLNITSKSWLGIATQTLLQSAKALTNILYVKQPLVTQLLKYISERINTMLKGQEFLNHKIVMHNARIYGKRALKLELSFDKVDNNYYAI